MTATTSLAAAFDPRNNSLNALRLFFAVLVIVGHSSVLGYDYDMPALGSLIFQDLAVDGFFVISGYLITRSRLRGTSGLDYLRKRVLRIFPGYWVCLLVGAFLVGPTIWFHENGSLAGYLATSPGPFSYVINNITLFVRQYAIGDLLADSPVKGSINGSLWTLFHEFVVYLLIAALAAIGLLKMRSRVMLAIGAAYFVLLVWMTLDREGFETVLRSPVLAADAVRLGFMFVVGAALFLWSDKVPFNGKIAIGALVVFALSAMLPEWRLIGAVPFAFLVMWLAIKLPLTRVGATNDLSYGVYLYGWPSQQLLATWGVPDWGIFPYTALSIVMAGAAAYASWRLVESPAMRFKRSPRRKDINPALRHEVEEVGALRGDKVD